MDSLYVLNLLGLFSTSIPYPNCSYGSYISPKIKTKENMKQKKGSLLDVFPRCSGEGNKRFVWWTLFFVFINIYQNLRKKLFQKTAKYLVNYHTKLSSASSATPPNSYSNN